MSMPLTELQIPSNGYHEFYRDDFEPRPHYRPLWQHIRRLGQQGMAAKTREAELAMQPGAERQRGDLHPLWWQ